MCVKLHYPVETNHHSYQYHREGVEEMVCHDTISVSIDHGSCAIYLFIYSNPVQHDLILYLKHKKVSFINNIWRSNFSNEYCKKCYLLRCKKINYKFPKTICAAIKLLRI